MDWVLSQLLILKSMAYVPLAGTMGEIWNSSISGCGLGAGVDSSIVPLAGTVGAGLDSSCTSGSGLGAGFDPSIVLLAGALGVELGSSSLSCSGLGAGFSSSVVPLGGTPGAGLGSSVSGTGLGSGVASWIIAGAGEAGSGHEVFSPGPLLATLRCRHGQHPICSVSPAVHATTEPTENTGDCCRWCWGTLTR